jgi:hydroxypyruvate reductase
VPAAVRRALEHGEETPKVGRVGDRVILVAGIATMVGVAAAELGGEVVSAAVTGEVGAVGAMLAAVARRLAGTGRCAVAGGEPTVVVPAGAGRSGRAAQLALLVARAIDGVDASVLCAGTDGIDGTSDAAGAVIDGGTWARLRAHGVDGEAALARGDAAAALAAVGAAVVTGPTGVNHADVMMVCGRQGA